MLEMSLRFQNLHTGFGEGLDPTSTFHCKWEQSRVLPPARLLQLNELCKQNKNGDNDGATHETEQHTEYAIDHDAQRGVSQKVTEQRCQQPPDDQGRNHDCDPGEPNRCGLSDRVAEQRFKQMSIAPRDPQSAQPGEQRDRFTHEAAKHAQEDRERKHTEDQIIGTIHTRGVTTVSKPIRVMRKEHIDI
jgi:hypothetical protein